MSPVAFFAPTPPPYDPLEWVKKPFAERARLVCQSWALQGYGTPLAIYFVYALKVAVHVGGWLLWCSFTPGFEPSTISTWWLEPLAFQKAIIWSLSFEILGLGCGSGPLTGRYWPPIGGFLHFLRRGTTKLPLFPGLPILGGIRRTWLDVALYAGLLGVAGWALSASALPHGAVLALIGLVALLGVTDKTLFLAARAEHYWTTLLCFALASEWIAGAKSVQLALWFWAGVSKLNPHFPTVVAVMVSNSPLTRFEWLRKRMYRAYPDDLRPSGLAKLAAHGGAALEFAVPLVLAFAGPGPWLVVGMVLMLLLHIYITSNVPMGVPIEWNVVMVYGAFALFWAHPAVVPLELGSWPLALVLVVMLVIVPLLGNLLPHRISFLLAMRYYAGNWPFGIWLLRGDAHRKFERLRKSSGWIEDQLGRFYDERTAVGLVGKVMGFRLMHLHGRALAPLLPRAVDRFEDYEWVDGELIAGLALGWNFGDGHLHREQLLHAIQSQCSFEPGELRCIFVEPQALGASRQSWRIVDAATGLLASGEFDVAELSTRQPWEVPNAV